MSHNSIKIDTESPDSLGVITPSLNNLSDVNYTAGSNIDNYVLTYNHSTTSWGAEVGGGGLPGVTSASPSSNYTITTHEGIEEIYLLTPTTNIDVVLPATSSAGAGYKYNIKNLATNVITIKGASGDNIDGVAPTTGVSLGTQFESLTLVTDGSDWFII